MRNPQIPIVNFHGIGDPGRPLDQGEDRFWIGEARFRDILDRIVARGDGQSVAITFDDGNLSDFAIAAPELQRRKLGATFFVLAGRIGQGGSLDRQEIRELSAAGMEIGSHGMDHVDWTGLSAGALWRELAMSMAVLEDIVGAPVRKAAIPFGRYNAAVRRALREAGYLQAFSSDGGRARPGDFPAARTSVTCAMSDNAIEAVLSGRTSLPRAMRRWAGRRLKSWF